MMFIDYVGIAALTFVGMEFVARLMHKYVMHGLLWFLHEDHHNEKQTEFEKNDLFGLIFAIIALYFFFLGIKGDYMALSMAFGMTGYGVAYFFIHDMVIHDRHLHLRSWGLKRRPFRDLILVHDIHHKEGEGNWGFLFIIKGLDKVPTMKDESG
ncbi:MAG: sterol desaturase family protein [Saccharolobus sp.]|uniref:Beta-carotene hydroxylase n=2 Tax=Saccharolobus shibatae TaxID=2286 RepID=A0A8F5GTR2_SACSH|nr:sterol desaturase family protein [Saccharolobus shibatae]MCH4814724.1 sterol desaturase family protein [Saccharolobus shibatae]QXJ29219.1 Beta-carotene hydroxylase [Saccharolobus shibatae B12]QXJ32463.1 Beta-carotene hydroxylase [Saccharolobus shibatae]